MHVRLTQLSDGSFDLVFDKGALDALMGEPGPDSTVAGRAFLSEVARVTKAAGGLYMCVSLLQACAHSFWCPPSVCSETLFDESETGS